MAFDKRSNVDVTKKAPKKMTANQSIAVGEPNPSAPKRGLAGYTGPKVGSAEWKAARARGERPVIDYLKSQRAAKKAARPARPTPVRPNPTPRPMNPRPGGILSGVLPNPLAPKPMRPNLQSRKK